MGTDFPYLYRNSRAEAIRLRELQRYDDSFHYNVSCARAIEQAIRDHFSETDGSLKEGCAQAVLKQFGFQRVNFVLANSLNEMGCKHLIQAETRQWGQKISVPPDGKYNRYYVVDTATALLEGFTRQVKDAYQAFELFGPEHCAGEQTDLDYTGKVLVLSPDTLKESCWSPRNQLWLATGGFGCSPTARGRVVYTTCLGDGEQTCWDRLDFTGVLDEQFLPDWAAEKLAELRGTQERQPEQTSGGMEMK